MLIIDDCIIITPTTGRDLFVSENILKIKSTHALHRLQGEYVGLRVSLSGVDNHCELLCLVEVDDEIVTMSVLQPIILPFVHMNSCHCVLEVSNESTISCHKIPLARLVTITSASPREGAQLPRKIRQALLKKTVCNDQPIWYRRGGKDIFLTVSVTGDCPSPRGIYRICNFTQFVINNCNRLKHACQASSLDVVFDMLREDDPFRDTLRGHLRRMVQPFLSNYAHTGSSIIAPVSSIIVSAPSGSGVKCAVAKELHWLNETWPQIGAGKRGVTLLEITSSSLMPPQSGNWVSQEHALRTALHGALAMRPCVVYVDRLEAIAPNVKHFRVASSDDTAVKLTQIIIDFCQFIGQGSGGQHPAGIPGLLLVARTEHLDNIAPYVASLADETVVVPCPGVHRRQCVLAACIRAELLHCDNVAATDAVTKACEYLVHEVAGLPMVDTILEYSQQVRATIRRAVDCDKSADASIPNAFEAGYNMSTSVQATVMETILLPRRFASIYSAYGVLPPTAVLLHGPPGTGKTWIAGAVAREISGHFISMKLSDILSGHVGVAESRVREVFSEAKLHSPCIVFIDEFQALFAARHDSTRGDNGNGASLTSTLSGCLDDIATWNASAGLDAMVTVIAATNEPWAIDVGFLRPGRFDKVLYVGPMNKSERTQLIVAQIQKLRGVLEVDCDASIIADRTAGFTAADISHLFQRICDLFIDTRISARCAQPSHKEVMPKDVVSWDIVEVALRQIPPSCSASEVQEYTDWEKERYRFVGA